SLLRFVKRYCDLLDTRPTQVAPLNDEGSIRARANYSRAVVCEGVANALVHRDLVVRDVTTRVHIFDRAIEIVNQRRSAGFEPEALRSIRFGVQHRLNPQIACLFYEPAYGPAAPTGGLPTLLREA